MKKIIASIIGVVALVSLAACETEKSATQKETNIAREQLDNFLTAQPVPVFAWSQLRQNLIELETAQAQTTVTTSFFFNVGVADPMDVCSSIGFPIPATYQLTASEGKIRDHELTAPQLEATGVYTGDTSGTYVICVDANGQPYANYHEGPVKTVSGPAKWDYDKHQVVLTGAPTGDFSVGK
jgi:hypothetical protein